MSIMRRIGATLAVAVLSSGLGLAAVGPAEASVSGAAEARTAVLPAEGHYRGADEFGRIVEFSYTHGRIRDFSIGHRVHLPGAPVQGHHLHHVCNHQGTTCVRGSWVSDAEFVGHWNDPRQSRAVEFYANHHGH